MLGNSYNPWLGGTEQLGHLLSLTLTNSLGVPEILFGLRVWLQLLTLIANVDPFVFHDLLQGLGGQDQEGGRQVSEAIKENKAHVGPPALPPTSKT